MAKLKDSTYRDAKGKVTFVMFQMEGDDETLQQGVRAMEQAFQRLGGPARAYAPSAGSVSFIPKKDVPIDAHVNSNDIEHEPVMEQGEETVPEVETQKSGKPRKYTQPKFLSDLELTSDKGSFKDYATKKNPEADNHKYLVASRWLQLNKNLDSITIDHIFTCFQAMQWASQKDVSQPLRVMTKNNSYYEKNGKGWKLTHVGGDAADAIGA